MNAEAKKRYKDIDFPFTCLPKENLIMVKDYQFI